MSEYRYLCPKCGHAFLEGTSFTHCPTCQVMLLEAPHDQLADLRNLTDHVDLDELMRKVLAEQYAGEDIESAMRRIVKHEYPDVEEGLCRVVNIQLDTWQKIHSGSRQEAAQALAESQSELTVRPGQKFEVQTIATKTRLFGIGKLSTEQRQQMMTQIDKVLQDGNNYTKVEFGLPAVQIKTSWIAVAAAVALLGVIAWRAWVVLH